MKGLFIEPLDVLMFRNQRPFTAKEIRVAKMGVISPLTFEGAIKSKIFSRFCSQKSYLPQQFQRRKFPNEDKKGFNESLEELKHLVEEKIKKDSELKELLCAIGYTPLGYPSKLNVLGVFFAKKDELMEYFRLPKDVVIEEDKDNDKDYDKLAVLSPKKEFCFSWQGNDLCVGMADTSQVKSTDGFISFTSLMDYLNGKGFKQCKKAVLDRPYLTELRTGIELEKGIKKPVESALYTAEFMRLKEDFGFIVWYEFPEDFPFNNYFLDETILRLGGEGRGAIAKLIEESKIDQTDLIKQINKDKRFKLYLATPSYFNGCVPPKEKIEHLLGLKLKLVSAFPGKPVYIGGYDFAMNREKPLRRWVDAGAVYYYEFTTENEKIKDDVVLPLRIIDKDIDMRCAFLGRWENV